MPGCGCASPAHGVCFGCAQLRFGCALLCFGCALLCFGCAQLRFVCVQLCFGCAQLRFGCVQLCFGCAHRVSACAPRFSPRAHCFSLRAHGFSVHARRFRVRARRFRVRNAAGADLRFSEAHNQLRKNALTEGPTRTPARRCVIRITKRFRRGCFLVPLPGNECPIRALRYGGYARTESGHPACSRRASRPTVGTNANVAVGITRAYQFAYLQAQPPQGIANIYVRLRPHRRARRRAGSRQDARSPRECHR